MHELTATAVYKQHRHNIMIMLAINAVTRKTANRRGLLTKQTYLVANRKAISKIKILIAQKRIVPQIRRFKPCKQKTGIAVNRYYPQQRKLDMNRKRALREGGYRRHRR
jgi:hypothetical protein